MFNEHPIGSQIREIASGQQTALASGQRDDVPDAIWHYTDAQGLMGILDSGAIHGTSHDHLNDSSELSHGQNLGLKIAGEFLDDPSTLARLTESVQTSAISLTCVASLSEDGNQLGQWRAYCPEYGGYSLGFLTMDLARSIATQNGSKAILAKVLYDKADQRGLLEGLIKPSATAFHEARDDISNEEKFEELSSTFCEVLAFQINWFAPVLKHFAFKEEREWRVIYRGDTRGANLQFRVGKRGLIPFAPIRIANADDRVPIAFLRIGPHPDSRDAWLSARWFLHARNLLHRVDVSVSDVPYRTW